MKLLTLTEGNYIDEMLKSEGWKVLESIVADLSEKIERDIMSRTVSIEKKEQLFRDLYCLQDFMRLPSEAIALLVSHEKNKDIAKKEFDPYHTVKSITKDSE